MPVNMDKPHRWKDDVARSVDQYNEWFMRFAPGAYRETRFEATKQVETALALTNNLTDISSKTLAKHPEILPILRMSTAPPIARDRLIGLASVSPSLVNNMEKKQRVSPKLIATGAAAELEKIGTLIHKLADVDLFPWLENRVPPSDTEIHRAATVVADRLCGALADPIVRNAQEKRQLAMIRQWLEQRQYTLVKPASISEFREMVPGTFAFHLNVSVALEGGLSRVNIPIDVAILPHKGSKRGNPLLIECKSAGDFTNTNKRRKEEAVKISQLRANYGKSFNFILFLCGYFDSGYLGYEAAEGIDWVWEHRIDDLAKFGL
ncbi:MAG: XamI family restriction endonuclease [Candidatus Hydrogenedentes bacterium]|nr:XamI family restriction endonuclease [Candidatus Hydrogenedentota bacterium]